MSAAELSGARLDAAYAVACGVKPDRVRIRDGRCEIWDNPCGFPGACWGWNPFGASTLDRDMPGGVGNVYVRYGGVNWKGEAGPELVEALRVYVASKFGADLQGIVK